MYICEHMYAKLCSRLLLTFVRIFIIGALKISQILGIVGLEKL